MNFTKHEFTKLVADIGDRSSAIKYDFEIAEDFSKLLEENKDRLTSKQEQQLKWEFLLFRLTTKNSFASDGFHTERFVPMATFADGSIFPDPNSLPNTALRYFELRAKTVVNSILKARYLDILWEKSKSRKKYLFAIDAVEQYILNVDAYENEDAIMEKLDGLQRATELVLILESNLSKKPLTDKVIQTLNNQIDKTVKDNNHRWLIEMFELVLALSDSYSNDQIKDFVNLCDKAAAHYHSDQNFHLQRSFLQLRKNLVKLLDYTPDTKKILDDDIGQSYIDEAEAKSGSGLVKVHFLQEAVNYYSKLGNKKKVEELIGKIKTATAQAIENKEFKEFSSTIELKKEDIEKMKASLGTGEEVPEKVGTLPTFPDFPDTPLLI